MNAKENQGVINTILSVMWLSDFAAIEFACLKCVNVNDGFRHLVEKMFLKTGASGEVHHALSCASVMYVDVQKGWSLIA